jgi:Bax protein
MKNKFRFYLTALLACCVLLPACAFSAINQTHQEQFIKFILKQSIIANHEITEQRAEIIKLHSVVQAGGKLSTRDRIWLNEMAREYKVAKPDFTKSATWDDLLQRVGIIPNSLVIAQAINESAWGTSRFAREGHNYFGQWCYSAGCGLVPLQRDADGDYEVRTFPNALSSVRSYMHNLNSTHLYHNFRERRHQLHSEGQMISGLKLVGSLRMYSIKRDDYVRSIQEIIVKYDLSQYDVPAKPAVTHTHKAPPKKAHPAY